MICDFCGKVKEQSPNTWTNYELNEQYKICDECISKIKSNTFKE